MKVGFFIVGFLVMVEATRRKVTTSASDSDLQDADFVDLTHPLDENTLGWPGSKSFQLNITYKGFTDDGYWLQIEDFGAAIHVGTHMDAPCHIVKGQWKLEQIPLDRFVGPAAMVDISKRAQKDRNTNLETRDLKRWEKVNNQSLNGTIVLINTGWSKKWKNKEDFLGTADDDASKLSFPGVSAAAATFLAKCRNIKGLGIDTTSIDNGQAVHRKAHEALFRANIYGLENVANLHKIPAYGASLTVFPMRIEKACGAPVRIIAKVPRK